jgi:hypothetical protein
MSTPSLLTSSDSRLVATSTGLSLVGPNDDSKGRLSNNTGTFALFNLGVAGLTAARRRNQPRASS